MTSDEWLAACKTGLNIPLSSTALDGVLSQKLLAVKGYLKGAGVPDTALESDLGIGTVVIGVSDLWTVESGEAKFSPVFHGLITQLSCSGGG